MSSALIVGIGNVLLGDEGVGPHVIRYLQSRRLPEHIICLDAGTGTTQLLEPMLHADVVVIIDAAVDGSSAGTVRCLHLEMPPRYSPGLTVHDLSVIELLATCRLENHSPTVTVLAVSIEFSPRFCADLSAAIATLVPELAKRALQEINRQLESAHPS